MSERDLEALPDVRSDQGALMDIQEWSKGPPGCPGVVGSLSRMSKSGRETFPDVWEWS